MVITQEKAIAHPVELGDSAIEIKDLVVNYGSKKAVDHLTLSVPKGSVYGFLGPNGAGKTTTIKMLTGLLHPTAGTASIGGFDIQREPLAAKRILGYIPDNPFLYEKLSGREYLGFMADLYSVPKEDRARRIPELLRLFELEAKGGELIQAYSRGMRQKIALAGALIHTPQVIFLDEPTVGLDPKGARAMRDILRELCRRGVTVFMSTHILEVAERTCDRVAIVNQGRIVIQGTMEELRAQRREAALVEGSPDEPDDGKRSLEEIFLELTDDNQTADLAQYLS